tara:strand:- start:1298 stop:2305 length:1008 start_codon:yes stop_codon:yes gene_type:complete
MITNRKLIEHLSNFKEKPVSLSKHNKFTQKTAYQLRVSILEMKKSLEDNLNGNFIDDCSMSQITQLSKFENRDYSSQSVDQGLNESTSVDTNLMIYDENEILGVPSLINDILENDNNWYLYGVKNPDSFFKSILLLVLPEYILKSNSEKLSYVFTYKNELGLHFESYYKKNKYLKLKFKKDITIQNLINGIITDFEILYLADYVKANLFIIDLDTKLYKKFECIYSDQDQVKNYIFIKKGDIYLPLMNSMINHLISDSIVSKLINTFNQDELLDCFKNRHLNASEKKLTINKNISLVELQKIAIENSINIKKQGKSKEINKTKTELIEELENVTV